MGMKVSIVIPCFNHARFLGEAIRSALAQDYRPLEVVVIDDGSTDGSAHVAASFPDVTCYRQDNRGLSRARNVGLAATNGDVLIFLDADDRLMPGAVTTAVKVLTTHPGAQMVFGRCRIIDEDGQPLPTNLPRVHSAFYEELLRHNFIWMPAMAALRRSAFDLSGPFKEHISPSADYELYLRLARDFEIVAHDGLVAEYRQHGANMTSNPALMLAMSLAVMRAQRPYVRRHRRLEAAYRAGVRHWRGFYGEQLVDRFRRGLHAPGSRWDAMRCAAQLIRLYPTGVIRHIGKKAASSVSHLF
jgi:glycosyltransferase involved in cell wall biosynthesis